MFHLPLCPVHCRLPRNYLCILARGSSSGPLRTRNSESLNHFLQVCQFNKCLPKGHLSSCLPLFFSLLVCLQAGAFWLLSPAHQLCTSLTLSRMWPPVEATLLTPVSEVTDWYPLHFLPSSLFFLHLSFMYVQAAAVTERNIDPSLLLADSRHPAPETELTPRQLELNSSKGCALAVLENAAFQASPHRTWGSTRELWFIKTFWRGILLLRVSDESTCAVGQGGGGRQERRQDGKGPRSSCCGRAPGRLREQQAETQNL